MNYDMNKLNQLLSMMQNPNIMRADNNMNPMTELANIQNMRANNPTGAFGNVSDQEMRMLTSGINNSVGQLTNEEQLMMDDARRRMALEERFKMYDERYSPDTIQYLEESQRKMLEDREPKENLLNKFLNLLP